MNPTESDPGAAYRERLQRRSAQASARARSAGRLSNARLIVFFAAAVVSWFTLGVRTLDPLWLLPPWLGFVALVVAHDRVLRAQRAAEHSVAYYDDGLARLEDRFAGRGLAGDGLAPEGHLYASDLDLFGEGSLYERLCRARSRAGRERLAHWLLEPAEPDEVRARQAAVEELASRIDLRERLALVGEDASGGLEPARLVAWGAEGGDAPSLAVRVTAATLSLASATALVGWVFGPFGPAPALLVWVVQSGVAWRLRSRVRRTIAGVERAARDLDLFSELLAGLEAEHFSSPRLAALRAAVETDGIAPSLRIRQLRRRIDLLDARRNQLFAPLAAMLLWTTQTALSIEHWRAAFGPHVDAWLDAVGELEALSSLATQRFEQPDDVFPEISEDGPRFEGRAIGHPLLPVNRCVRNDVALSSSHQVMVVSGSNMSGKSTLLRSVGTNAVLALAGAPVRAASLQLSPLTIGASIRVNDSLQEGSSRFYAEIQRIAGIVAAHARERPVLFLLDEILHGTNSHDREIGARAIVEALVDRGAIGLVTTHDLALAQVAERLAPRGENVHFEDHLEDGQMRFDYRMRPGVVRKSNALELMRAVGLDV